MADALNLSLYWIMDLLSFSLFWKRDTPPFENLVQNALISRMQWIISYFRKIFKTSELSKTCVVNLTYALFGFPADSTI